MPSFELPIRSLSILFIFGAMIAILWFPENPHSPDIARAFFWWFLALGVVRWVEHGILRLFSTGEGKIDTRVKIPVYIIALGFHVWFLVKGIQYFSSVLSNL